jgi:hypothetical protein
MNVVALATCWVPGLDEVTATAAITLDVASGLVNAGLAYSKGDDLSGTEALAGTAMMAIPGVGAAGGATEDVARSLTDDAEEAATPSTRNGALAGSTHPKTDVPFGQTGYPDFSQWRHPDVPDVTIEPSGTRAGDFARANEAAGRFSRRRLESILNGLGLSWDRLIWVTRGLK